MASAGTLHDAFIDELRDVYHAEKQITKALPKMIKAATSDELRQAFENHLEETKARSPPRRGVRVSDEKVKGKKCDGMAGIIEEGRSAMGEDFDEQTMDAALIASAQRVEHYEMAAYGTLVAWAEAMGHTEAAELLQATLDEEKATDEKLTRDCRRRREPRSRCRGASGVRRGRGRGSTRCSGARQRQPRPRADRRASVVHRTAPRGSGYRGSRSGRALAGSPGTPIAGPTAIHLAVSDSLG